MKSKFPGICRYQRGVFHVSTFKNNIQHKFLNNFGNLVIIRWIKQKFTNFQLVYFEEKKKRLPVYIFFPIQ